MTGRRPGPPSAHTEPVTNAASDGQHPPKHAPGEFGADEHALFELLLTRAFGDGGVAVTGIEDVNRGRGAFSMVVRLTLEDLRSSSAGRDGRPTAVVAKLPVGGPNGAAAIAAGAYQRESLAYRRLLNRSPVTTPTAFAVEDLADQRCALLLQDLTGHRHVDQLDGLSPEDAGRVATELAGFHHYWSTQPLGDLAVRRNTIAGLSQDGLDRGLAQLETTWADDVTPQQREAFVELVRVRPALADRFEREPATLCHGDPRADNLVFEVDNSAVLFDWQQMAVQFGETDLAWLAATSLNTDIRRDTDQQLVKAYDGDFDRYRLGLALPGLAVLFLAQRSLSTERTRRLVAVSLQRIADAVIDLEVATLAN